MATSLGEFNSLTNSTFLNVSFYITDEENFDEILSGDDNLLELIKLDIDNSRLVINHDESCISTKQEMYLTLANRFINKIINSGSGEIIGPIGWDDLELINSGSGDIIITDFDGLEKNTIDITNSGSGDADCEVVKVRSADVTNSGSGDVYIYATEEANIVISGSGDVYYRGTPDLTTVISGSGELIDNN